MNRDIDSLAQTVSRTPLDAPGLEPLTNFLNLFIVTQARDAKVAIRHYADDIQVTELVRQYAKQMLEVHIQPGT